MSKAAWIIFSAVIVLILGGLVIYSRVTNPSADVSSVNSNAIIAASDQNGQIADHTLGNTDSKVVLIEYGDFQCPSCGAAHPHVKELAESYKDDIVFIFRNFPLTTIHPNARSSAAAVEAAGLSGKYWEMHDLIFENQEAWSTLVGQTRTDTFAEYAVSLGINKDTFLENLGASNVNQKISFDQALGKKAAVDSTPSFFLNGEKLSSEVASGIVSGDTSKLRALIESKLSN